VTCDYKLAENSSLAFLSGQADKNQRTTAVVAEYHFVLDQVASESWADGHRRVLELLVRAANASFITRVERHERDSALPANDRDGALLKECRWFAMTHHVAIRLGSRRSPYGWFPPQLLILRSGSEMLAVLPCEIEGRPIEVEQFLEAILRGEAWTTVSSKPRNEVGPHKRLIESIVADPTRLEVGLRLIGQNTWVADLEGETGYIDLVCEDSLGRYLLVEVKVKADEVDKGIGQIIRHGVMFVRQNFLSEERVRLAVACPDIPPVRRAACAKAGVEYFELKGF
jgi:hypothetical protein